MRKSFLFVVLVLGGLLALAAPAFADDFQCNGTFTSETFDDVTVPAGGSCTLVNSTVADDVDVQKNAFFQSIGTAIGGNVEGRQAETVFLDNGSRVFGHVHGHSTAQVFVFNSTVIRDVIVVDATDKVQICGSLVSKGDIDVNRSGTDILIGDPQTEGCPGNVVRRGDVEVRRSFTDVEFVVGGNTIRRGDLEVFDNAGPVSKLVQGNAGGDDLRCRGNSQPFSASGNTGWEHKTGQCG